MAGLASSQPKQRGALLVTVNAMTEINILKATHEFFSNV